MRRFILASILLLSLSLPASAQILGGSGLLGGGNAIAKLRPVSWHKADFGTWTDAAALFVPADTAHFDMGTFYDPGTSDFTVASWMRLTAVGAFMSPLGTGANGDGVDGFRFLIGATGGMTLEINDSVQATRASGTLAANGTFSDSTWYLVIVAFDRSGNATCYVNDVTKSAVDISTHTATLGATAGQIGAFVGNYLDGTLDEVAVWDRLLTSDERTWLYNSGSGRLYDDTDAALQVDMSAWWGLGEASGVRSDQHGSNDLTETGGTIDVAPGIVRGATVDTDGLSYWSSRTTSVTATIETLAKRPEWSSTEPAIVADGVDDYLDVSTLGAASDWTIFVVINPDAAAGADEILLGQATLYLSHLTGTAGQVGIWTGGAFVDVAAATADLQVLTYSLNSTGTNGELFRNGSKLGASFVYAQSALDAANIAADGAGTGSFYAGEIRELIVFDSVLTAAHRSKVDTYLINRHSITP